MRSKLKKFFYFFSLGILCIVPLCSFTFKILGSEPVASNVLNFLIQNISGRSQILPLIGSDADGTVVSFKILSLPNTAAGDLYLNGVAVTINQVLNPTEAKQLQFEVKTAFITGNASFTYTVTDNEGLTDASPATFTIPVTNNGSLLVCTGGGLGPNILGEKGTFSAPYITPKSTISCINDGHDVASPLSNLGNAVTGLTTYNYASTSGSLGPEGTYSFLKTLGNMSTRNCIKTDWVASDHTGDGGYAMIVNGSPNSNSFGKTFYQASTIAVCPNTLYEFSAYVINVLPGNHAAATPGSEPNISFYINGQLVSTSGAIAYANASNNYVPQWVKVGGLWYSGPNTSVNLKIDNATFVAGGNDLGLDDISLAICGPEITYPNISLTPQFCSYGVLPLNAQVRASINTYSSYIFQLSTDGGNIWNDLGTAKTGSPVYDALTNSYLYTAEYGDIPIDPSMNGYRYRLKVATDSPNLTGTTCNVSADKIITVSAFTSPVGGADIVSCNAISTATLNAAQSGETWSASASNPAAAAIAQNGQVSGLSVNGIYEFYLANAAGCVDTVKIARSQIKSAGSDAVVCSDQDSYKFADAPAGYEWQLVSGNPSAATIDPNTGYVSNLGVNGDYQFQLVSKIAPCADIVKLTKGICPKVNFRTGTSSFSENAGAVKVEVYLDQASTLAVTVPYSLGSGTASSIADFTTTTGNLVFNPGETSKFIDLSLIDDNIIEPDETIIFDLGAPVNASLGTIYQHTLTILNDDAAICIAPDAAVRNEGNTGAGTAYTFTVTRSAGSFMANAINFSYQLSAMPGGFNAFDLIDQADLNKVLNATIPAGQNSVSLSYLIKPDLMMENDDPFKITIVGADIGIQIDCPEAEGLVLNDDLNKTIIQFETTSSQTPEGAVNVRLKVILSTPSVKDIDVPFYLTDITTTNDVDYADILPAARFVHFNTGDEEAFITIAIKEDTADEPDESMKVTLTDPGESQFVLGSQINHTVTIMDDDPIIVQDDFFTTNEDTPLTNTVKTNDYDPGGDPLTFTVLTGPQHGQLQFDANGTFTYTPAQDYSGNDSFTYRGCNVNNTPSCGNAVVYLTVVPVNEPPLAGDDQFTGAEDAVITGTVIANDSDPDGDALTFTRISIPSNGTLLFSTDGSFIYTPEGDFHGTDSFTYRACDPSGFCAIAEVKLLISPANDPPKANNDSFAGLEDSLITANVSLNDTDPDNDVLTFTKLTNPSHGILTFNSDGTFIYTPELNFNGIDKFTYKTCDPSGACDQAEVLLTVSPVNDPPLAVNDAYQAMEDVSLKIPAPGILINDSDPEGDRIVPVLRDKALKGDIFVNQDGSFVYNPYKNQTGEDKFTYVVNDGFLNSNVATVKINISAVNDPPEAADDNFRTPEDIAITGTVAANDADAENDPLIFSLVSNISHGQLVFKADGSFNYTPDKNYNGPDKFTYKVCDPSGGCAQAQVFITVEPLNDPPVAVDDAYQTMEDVSLKIPAPGILINDSDPEGDKIVPVLRDKAIKGDIFVNQDGSFVYNPYKNLTGEDKFTYVVNDGFLNSNVAMVKINISAVNDPPQALDDNFRTPEDIAITGTVAANDADAENDPLIFSLVSNISHGQLTFKADGSFIYTPNKNYNGPDKFTYKVCDPSGGCALAQAFIIVEPLNDPPVAVDDAFKTPEDITLTGNVSPNDSDPEGEQLTFTLISSPSHGHVAFKIDGSFTYVPQNNYNGPDKFLYKVCDVSGGCSQAEAMITVVPVNDPPVAVNDTYQTPIGSPLQVKSSGVLTNDSDPDNDKLTAVLLSNPAHGKVTLNPDGSFLYIPEKSFQGEESFTYLANDGTLNSNIARVIINIPGNSASALTGIVSLTPSISQISEGESLSITAELSNELAEDLVVTLGFGGTAKNTIDAEDYHLTGNYVTIRIAAGQTKTTEKFTIEALADDLKEGDEFFDALIVSVSSLNAIIGSGAQVTIKDIYPPVAVVKRELPPNPDILPDPLFSPNGDGNGNEVFNIINIGLYPQNEVAIFNRWGNEVYRIKGYDNYNNAFKGKANRGLLTNTSVDLVDGVYYYMIYSFSGTERRLNKGYVILKR